MIKNLTLLLTNKCNGKCRICNIWQHKITENEMTVEQIQKLLLLDDFKEVDVVSLSGGEPFLRNDILEILQIIFESLKNLNTLYLNTNAILIKNIYESCELAVKNVANVVLSVSLEGGRQTNYNVRGIDNYNTAIELLTGIKKKFPSIKTSISMTLNPYNANLESLEHVKYIASHTGSDYSFRFADNSEDYYHNEELMLEVDKNSKNIVAEFIKNNLYDNPFMQVLYNYIKTNENPLVIDKYGKNICMAGSEFVFVKPDGTIYPCLGSNRCIGNLERGIFEKNIKDLGKYEKCPCCTECCTWPMITMNAGLEGNNQ